MASHLPNLYALKEDLDMAVQDIQNLKIGYGALDHIVKIVDDLKLEQLFQAAQMRRLEERMNNLEKRMDRMEKLLLLICKKLEIEPII